MGKDDICKLSILIVGRDPTLKKLYNAILWQIKKMGIKCDIQVDICEIVSDVLQTGKKNDYDFVVLTFDMGYSNCIQEIRQNIPDLTKQLIMHRVCMVSIADTPACLRCVENNEVFQLREEFSTPIIFGDIKCNIKCLYMAERILLLVKAVIGLSSGIPNLL